METIELWRPVVGLEGLYEVSSLGRVKSMCYHGKNREKELGYYNDKGYFRVKLTNGKSSSKIFVHRLVAEAYPDICGETFPGWCVDHLNRNTVDNRAKNLRVCTMKENMNNPRTRQVMSESHKGKVLSAETKKKISESHMGKVLSEETRKKISEAHMGSVRRVM